MTPAYARIRSLEPGEVDDLLRWIAGAAPSQATVALLAQCRKGHDEPEAGEPGSGASLPQRVVGRNGQNEPEVVGSGGGPETTWLLAHCDDGVTWGRCEKGDLVLSCDQYRPEAGRPGWQTPLPEAGNLQQLRIFGEAGEILVWRQEGARRTFGGRLTTDVDVSDARDPLRPLLGSHVLLGTETAPGGETTAQGFTAVMDPAGRVQVLPWRLEPDDFGDGRPPLRLRVVHHLQRDDDTGCVSIAASRLAGIEAVPADAGDPAGPADRADAAIPGGLVGPGGPVVPVAGEEQR